MHLFMPCIEITALDPLQSLFQMRARLSVPVSVSVRDPSIVIDEISPWMSLLKVAFCLALISAVGGIPTAQDLSRQHGE